jgi:amicyanin
MRRARAASTTILCVTLGALAASSLSANAVAAGLSASIANFQFEPSSVTIMTGETVTWTNKDAVAHTVTATGKKFDSGKMQAGKSFSFTFNTPGTYLYTCTLHPYMKGEVIVQGMGSSMHEMTPHPPPTPSVPAPVAPGGVSVHLMRHGHSSKSTVSVSSAHPGAQVLLQLYSREHFSWLQVAHTTLSTRGHALLKLKASVHRPLRVIVVEPALGTKLTSVTLHT